VTKPIVFFSHSSRDKLVLQRLKEQFVKKTGSSIEVFLSSDGESIPLGRNWVHKVQEALEQAKLQVVFLTENAFKSGWTYFESGFSYSKGIRVVPVGFQGVDLSQVQPPLGLLQGFNISNEEGLNNLIALVNEVLGHRHELSFTKEEYEQLFQGQEHGRPTALGDYASTVEKIFLRFNDAINVTELKARLQEISVAWSANSIASVFAEKDGRSIALHAHGVSLTAVAGRAPYCFLSAEVEPLALEYALQIIQQVRPSMKGVVFEFRMKNSVRAREDYSSMTARFIGNEDILLLQNERFGFKSFEFLLERSRTGFTTAMTPPYTRLIVTLNTDTFPSDEFCSLLEILFQREILYFETGFGILE
jgi:hypothetical protein